MIKFNDVKMIWEEILTIASKKMSVVFYDMWAKALEPINIIEDKLIVFAPVNVKRMFEKTGYDKLLNESAREISSFLNEVEIIDENTGVIDSLLMNEKLEEDDEKQQIAEEDNILSKSFVLDDLYTFDSFVIGGSNQIAIAAAKVVAEFPGTKHNPLFIHGGVGLGKTHIMHAIGNYIKKNNPNKKILYVTTEQFTNEYIDSIAKAKDNDLNKQFRERYRNVDVLMLDDIQFISGKMATQEALFHTFNDLYQTKRQIIFTSDCHPKDINNLEERLKSRFQCGLTVDISAPDLETRIAILQKKSFQKKYSVSPVVINYIAEKISTNIRELEAALSKVIFYCSLTGLNADNVDVVNEALKDEIDSKSGPVTIDFIVDKVCGYFMVDKKDLVGKKKTKQIAEARQIAIYIISDLLSIPLISIGDYFGGRDHSTVIHARDKIAGLINTSSVYRSYIKDLMELVKNRG